MRTVCNRTRGPLSIPLPRGKVLHLGPGKSGQIASNAVDHPALKKLVDGGAVEVSEDESGRGAGSAGGNGGRMPMQGWASGRGGRRSGDR